MKRKIVFIIGTTVLFAGCSIVQPSVPNTIRDNNISKSIENNETMVQNPIVENKIEVIESIFSDEFEDGADSKSLIESLDAFPWEKEALEKIYSSYDKLWENSQKKEFEKILETNAHLSICGDRRYIDNLDFIEEGTKKDILYTVILLRYISNLNSGCVEWVSSDGQVKNENSIESIQSNYLLSMLPKGVLINKLLLSYYPKNEAFVEAVKQYKAMELSSVSHEELKIERLNIEQYKMYEEEPNYN